MPVQQRPVCIVELSDVPVGKCFIKLRDCAGEIKKPLTVYVRIDPSNRGSITCMRVDESFQPVGNPCIFSLDMEVIPLALKVPESPW